MPPAYLFSIFRHLEAIQGAFRSQSLVWIVLCRPRVIERFQRRLDDRMIPVPIIPDQDIGPWLRALKDLLTDRTAALYHPARDTPPKTLVGWRFGGSGGESIGRV
jgi:hypothetical protein